MGIMDLFRGRPQKSKTVVRHIAVSSVSRKTGAKRVQAMNAFNRRSFEAATTDRMNSNWRGAGRSVNQEIRFSLEVLRAKARDLAQNDPIVKKYLRVIKKYVIGPEGFTFKVKSFDYVKDGDKWKKKYDSWANTQIEEAFYEWTKKQYCTVKGNQTFRQFLYTLQHNKEVDGEVFIIKLYPNKKSNPFCFTLQAIEASMVDEHLNMPLDNGNIIVMGIEYTAYLKPVAYWFRTLKPGYDMTMQYYSRDYKRVPAEDVYHYYTQEFVGQLRGYTEFVQIANRLKILKGYEEAALINARSAAMKTLVLQYSKTIAGEISSANIAGAQKKDDGSIEYTVEPGQVYIVPRGMEKVDYNPAYPQGEHKPFTEHVMYTVASGFDVDYPTLSSNLSGVNYTSIRHGMMDSRLGYKIKQADLREDVIEPVFSDWLLMAFVSASVNLPIEKYDKFNKLKAIGFTPDWVDPLKDGRAKIEGLESLLETYEDALAEKGKDLEEHLDQLQYEKEELEKRGLLRAGMADYPALMIESENDKKTQGDKNE